MIKTIILEDEPDSLALLENMLVSNFSGKLIISDKCSNIDDMKLSIEKHKPDLLFLDIEVSGKSSFELLENIANPKFDIIFTTAFSQYALKAIKFSAIDYLLKPIDEEELKIAVEKILSKKINSVDINSLKLLMDQLKAKENSFSKISLPSIYGVEIVNLNDIIRCDSEDHYTRFTLANKRKLLVSNTLKYYEDLLPSDRFFRIHNSHIVNLHHVIRVTKEGYALLSDDSTAEISRRKKEAFLQKISTI